MDPNTVESKEIVFNLTATHIVCGAPCKNMAQVQAKMEKNILEISGQLQDVLQQVVHTRQVSFVFKLPDYAASSEFVVKAAYSEGMVYVEIKKPTRKMQYR